MKTHFLKFLMGPTALSSYLKSLTQGTIEGLLDPDQSHIVWSFLKHSVIPRILTVNMYGIPKYGRFRSLKIHRIYTRDGVTTRNCPALLCHTGPTLTPSLSSLLPRKSQPSLAFVSKKNYLSLDARILSHARN